MRKFIFLTLALFLFSFSNSFAEGVSTDSSRLDLDINQYQLPYPGILPDSPLYPIKAFRDRIVNFLITDIQKKIKFDIMEADKHLSAGLALFKKNKVSLSEVSISKGENYSEDALSKIKEAKKERLNIEEALRNFSLSLKVHKKTIAYLSQKAPVEFKKSFDQLEKRVDGLIKQTASF